MQDDPIEHTIKQYIATGATEGAKEAAEKLRQAIGVELDQVLATVQRAVEPAAAPARGGSVTVIAGLATAHASAQGAIVIPGDHAAAAVIRPADVDEVTRQASRGGLARLNANHRILVAVVLIAAIYPLLPHEVQEWLNTEPGVAAAIAAVLTLMKR